jgi:hypothetical protein
MNLIQIAQSWYAYLKGSPYTKQLMAKRLEICDGCEYKVMINAAGKVIVSLITNEPDGQYSCGACGCPLVGKTAGASNECPKGKWKAAGDESFF